MYAVGDKLYYGADAFPISDRKNHATAGSSIILETQGKGDITDKVSRVLKGSGPLVTSSYKDQYGTWRTGLASVMDSHGKIINRSL